jgi:hypothetical protein
MVMWGQKPDVWEVYRQEAALERPLIDLAEQWLKDPRPMYRAWGADIIRRIEVRHLNSELLIAALGDVSHIDPRDYYEEKARLGILDALIQLRVQVPEETSEGLFGLYRAQALILLYRGACPAPAVGAHILDKCQYDDECSVVAAQCLARQRGGPVELLERLQVKAEVEVLDTALSLPPPPAAPKLARIWVGPGPRYGFPELYTYYLTSVSEVGGGQTLLAAGRYPVYYVRAPDESRPPTGHLPLDRNEYALELLADKLGTKREALGLVTRPVLQLHWITAEQYRSDLQAFAAGQRHHYAELASLLLRQGELTPEESSRCHLNLDIVVRDR